jgi:hypothetical protein
LSFDNISFGKLAIVFIIAGVILVFAIMGSSATNLFSENITEEAEVTIKQDENCIVEASDEVPRTVANCPYNINDTIVITYKPQQPSVENHEIKANNQAN